MESSDFDDDTSVLLDPIFPRADGRIFRMPIDRFVEIILSFRQANRVEQCSVGTERMDYSECLSLGTVTECAQQTSVRTSTISCQATVKTVAVSCQSSPETSSVSCQTEPVSAKKLSGIVYPIQRTTSPVTAATANPVLESRSNANRHNRVTENSRTIGGATYQKVLEVVCRHVTILKDFVRTIRRSNPSELHKFVVLYADILSQFCLQLSKPGGRDLTDIVKSFQNNVAKDFERRDLWAEALKPDAVIGNGGRSRRYHHVERRHSQSNSHRQGGARNTNGHTKHTESFSNKSNRRSRDKESGSCDDESMAPLNKRARKSNESKDRPRYSSKSSDVSSKSAGEARQRDSTPTDKCDIKRHEETHRANRERLDLVIGKSDIRVNTKSSNYESRRDVNIDTKKVGCFKSSKLNDPRQIKSGEEDIGTPYSPSSPTDDHTDLKEIITPEFSSNTAYRPVDENILHCQSPNSSNGVSDHVDSGSYTLTRKLTPKSQTTVPSPRNPSPVLGDGEKPQQMNVRTSTNVSGVKQYTLDEAADMLVNFCKNFPYVQQPKMPSSKSAENCGHKGQPFNDTTAANPHYISEKNNDLAQAGFIKSNPSDIDGFTSPTLKAHVCTENDFPLKSGFEMKSPALISSDLSPLVSVGGGHNDCNVEAGNCNDISITSPVNVARDLPVEVDRKAITKKVSSRNETIEKEIKPSENGVKSDSAKIRDVNNGEICKESGRRACPKVSVLTATKGFIPKEVFGIVKNSDRLQTFCIGSPSNWGIPEKTSSQESKELEETSRLSSSSKQDNQPGPNSFKHGRKPSEVDKKLERVPCPGGEGKKQNKSSHAGGESVTLEKVPYLDGESKTPERAPCVDVESEKQEKTPLPNGESEKFKKSSCPGAESNTLERAPCPVVESKKLETTSLPNGGSEKLKSPCPGAESNTLERAPCPGVKSEKLETTPLPNGGSQMLQKSPCPDTESKMLERAPCPGVKSEKLETTPLPNGGSEKLKKSPCSSGESVILDGVPCPGSENKKPEETTRSSGESQSERMLCPDSESKNLDAAPCADGAANKKLEKTPGPTAESKMLAKTPGPVGKKRVRTPSLEGKKRPRSSPKYSRISTQITSRRNASQHAPYYHSENSYHAGGFGGNSQYHPHWAPSTSSNWESTEVFHPYAFLSFGGQMPNYGGFYGQ